MMNNTTLQSQTHDMPADFFLNREQAGPLTPIEQCYRAICTLGFARMIRCDSVMGQAELTVEGERWLEPVVRQILHWEGPLPVAAIDWITVYHRARHTALTHFSGWNRTTQHSIPGRQCRAQARLTLN